MCNCLNTQLGDPTLEMEKGMVDRLMEIGRLYGLEMNVEKKEAIRIPRQSSSIQIMIDHNNWRMWNISAIWIA